MTIQGSGNVSSITYNAVGDYTVNFTIAMPTANYAVGLSYGPGNGRWAWLYSGNFNNTTDTSRTVYGFRLFYAASSTSQIDGRLITAMVIC